RDREGAVNPEVTKRTQAATAAFRAAMDDDLNTAEALAAAFEYIRDANTALDAGQFQPANAVEALEFLALFDSVFDVLRPSAKSAGLSAAELDAAIAERAAAKKARNFPRSDEIRKQLADQGIILEDTKDGVRWKRA